MFDELWSEINDSQGEIFDVIEYKEEWEKEEKFDVENYINGNTDYFAQYDVNYDEELVKILCDAVCRNFPTN